MASFLLYVLLQDLPNLPVLRHYLCKEFVCFPSKVHSDRYSRQVRFKENYLLIWCEETLSKIWVLCENENIWLSVYETTDARGKKIANIVMGFPKRSNCTRTILSSVIPWNSCSESYSNSTCFRWRYAGSMGWQSAVLSYRRRTVWEKRSIRNFSELPWALHRACETI